MPVDEFGREIPAPPAPARHYSHPPHHHHQQQQHHTYSSNPSLGARGSHQPPPYHRGIGGSGGHRPPPNLSLPLSAPRHYDRDRERDRDRGAAALPHPSQHRRAPHHLSPTAQPPPQPLLPPPPPKPSHPSKLYQEDPLLCEFLWKQQYQQEQHQKEEQDESNEVKPAATSTTSYVEYRRAYCLRFVQSFFNAHLDHSWFRNLYSPACRRRQIERENARARAEAALFARGFLQSSGGDGNDSRSSSFVSSAELWGSLDAKLRGNDDTADLPVPESHQPSTFASALHLSDIPPNVVDDQVEAALLALLEGDLPSGSADGGGGGGSNDGAWLRVYSADPTPKDARKFLYREAVVVCRSPSIRQTLLNRLEQHQTLSSSIPMPPSSLIPRKEAESSLSSPSSRSGGVGVGAAGKVYALEVDCTDPYGRLEVDVRTHAGDAHNPEDHASVPLAKATLQVRVLLPPRIHVLTAALSAPSRIPSDKDAAVVMARALDTARKFEAPHKLDDVLEARQQESFGAAPLTDAEVLDVTVAYLRRVHLFSFYTCTSASNLAQFWTQPKNSTIHLRLRQKGASHGGGTDEAVVVGDDPSAGSDDLLVKLRDEQIAAVLEACPTWISGEAPTGGSSPDAPGSAPAPAAAVGVVTELMREQADAIEASEQATVEAWLNDHAILDDDRRARCSFHFCHKLFKDTVFLRKHLLKKHAEYLRAEQAKCSDEYMMAAWESAANRPVCDVLVDCGANFGLTPAALLPQSLPDCADPEPALWQREEEKRKAAEEQRQRREEMRQQQQSRETASSGPTFSRGFVDVDDMKEEKVELSFDSVPDPAEVGKKKKKKRKLL